METLVKICPVILSGGTGSRLWPLSRGSYPKQFHALVGNHSLLQNTVQRARGLDLNLPPVVISNREHRFIIQEQLEEIGIEPEVLILEPFGKNTAPAAALAALYALEEDPLLLVLPADHVIENTNVFLQAVNQARKHAEAGQIVTFGIKPDKPDCNFGYIKHGKARVAGGYPVEHFVEKPDVERAKQYLADGRYLWNSGMFMFRASKYLAEIEQHAPDIFMACKTTYASSAMSSDKTLILNETAFDLCPTDSIDYAIMEQCRDSIVVPLQAGWTDVGLWSSLHEVSQQDTQSNTIQGDVITEDVANCLIKSNGRLVAAIGIDNQIIVETEDAILVSSKEKAHQVKNIVERLKKHDRMEAESHCKVPRPWGHYETLALSHRYQVKRLVVKPGKSLSLQLHHHRAEHWTIVSGTALVTCNDERFILSENESTYIPIGSKHRLENKGKIPLEVIEVQTGSYLSEDDIVRFEDQYGRDLVDVTLEPA